MERFFGTRAGAVLRRGQRGQLRGAHTRGEVCRKSNHASESRILWIKKDYVENAVIMCFFISSICKKPININCMIFTNLRIFS